VYAGTALTGGGDTGDVTLGLTVPLLLGATVPSGAGVLEVEASGTNSRAIIARGSTALRAESASGFAISAEGATGITATGTVGWGIQGYSAANDGVSGISNDPSFTGVRGRHAQSGNLGYLGSNDWAMFGSRGDDSAVGGVGSTHGVYGRCTVGGSRYAGYFNGPVQVNGNLSKSGGSFKIDHPLDPANRYLSHSFVESPDMMNVYNGNVVTDADGYATVTLPDWFEALNRDFRYQLTVIGQFAQAIVAEKIVGNRFVIRTNLSQVEVSWQVTGIRQDAWANAHRIPVEEDKPAEEVGTYLAPELFGMPEELGLQWHQEEGIRRDRELAAVENPGSLR
jgi:hypothetical protein